MRGPRPQARVDWAVRAGGERARSPSCYLGRLGGVGMCPLRPPTSRCLCARAVAAGSWVHTASSAASKLGAALGRAGPLVAGTPAETQRGSRFAWVLGRPEMGGASGDTCGKDGGFSGQELILGAVGLRPLRAPWWLRWDLVRDKHARVPEQPCGPGNTRSEKNTVLGFTEVLDDVGALRMPPGVWDWTQQMGHRQGGDS